VKISGPVVGGAVRAFTNHWPSTMKAENEQDFLMEMSRRCFRFARGCTHNADAEQFAALGQTLLRRAHQCSKISAQGCTNPDGSEIDNTCADCTRNCPY